ncbi:hypothetical protein [Verrucosispora sioxanthis]|uniref:hypothetical protein n=1 Tax=Verrucosispora sioxanthis TaxID=2499994 RepID=UPI001F212CD3|nr:hypothetical protein [Verrucosispora sioxanthis]
MNELLLTVAVQVAFRAARLSVTVTLPSSPVMELPANAAPRFTDAGTEMSRFAVATVKVTMVSPDGAAAGAARATTAAAAAVRVRSGFLMPITLEPRNRLYLALMGKSPIRLQSG